METIDGDYFISKNHQIVQSAKNQSDKYAKSGKYSAKIDHENPFGLIHHFSDLKKGDQIIISVWEKSSENQGYLKLCKKDGTILQVNKREIIDLKNEWEIVTLSYIVDDELSGLKFYIHNESDFPAYYDDLKIEIFNYNRSLNMGNEVIDIQISNDDYNTLTVNREIALTRGVIDNSLKKYIKGFLTYKNQIMPIKLRFKGDWTDHLETDKWSFRIKMNGDFSFNGLKSFSVQSPHTRTFLKEWMIHKIFQKEDVLTTRYEFVNVKLNGKSLGIYAYEEHFDKQLLESNQRREGPIFKFNEEGLWETRINNPKNKSILPYYEAAEVIPFKQNRILNSKILLENTTIGTELMLKYKEFYPNLEEIFDLKIMARYYALCDVGRVRHSYHWHNQRFYYNPITKKLEPIAFDCYAGIEEGINDVIYGYSENDVSFHNHTYISKQLFNNPTFVTYYKDYLSYYSDSKYLDSVESEYKISIDSLTSLLVQEFPGYKYNLDYLKKNANEIQSLLPQYKNKVISYSYHDINYSNTVKDSNYYPTIGIKAICVNNFDSLSKELEIENFHFSKIKLIGYGSNNDKDSMVTLENPIMIDKYSNNYSPVSIQLPFHCNYLFFIPDNTKSIESTKINYWKYNSKNIKQEFCSSIFKIQLNRHFIIDSINHKINLKKGEYIFNSTIVIPKNYTLIIEKGTEIDLINGASLISFSPVQIIGSNSSPINFNSSDKTGGGMVVLNSESTSILTHVIFNNQNANNSYNWTLTGAVTFYESDVVISNSEFKNNKSEDGLNIIRSHFEIKNCFIHHTFSDAFDADFCTGSIVDSKFYKSGNDAVDLSGSQISINNINIESANDKAISNGERSNLIIKNCKIQNANIGIASKDNSHINIDDLTISNCNIGYAVFQKKAEFGPASIKVNSANESKINKLFILDKSSTIDHMNDKHIGSSHLDVDSLYLP